MTEDTPEEARDTIRRLRREITHMREAAEARNRQLDALGIVWCSGGCPGGMLRYHPDREVTAQDVLTMPRTFIPLGLRVVRTASDPLAQFTRAELEEVGAVEYVKSHPDANAHRIRVAWPSDGPDVRRWHRPEDLAVAATGEVLSTPARLRVVDGGAS